MGRQSVVLGGTARELELVERTRFLIKKVRTSFLYVLAILFLLTVENVCIRKKLRSIQQQQRGGQFLMQVLSLDIDRNKAIHVLDSLTY